MCLRRYLPIVLSLTATFLLIIGIVAFSAPYVFADTASEEMDKPYKQKTYTHIPISFSLLPGIGTSSLTDGREVVTNFSLNLIAGRYAKLYGFEYGIVLNWETEEAYGMQFSGVANLVQGYMSGFQSAGVTNIILGDLDGLQTSGAVNYVQGHVRIGQMSGAVNFARRGLEGVQTSGAGNYVEGDMLGFQASSALNMATGDLRGAQISGAVNYAGSNMWGCQGSSALNVALGSITGAQMSGAVNYMDGDMLGFQASGALNMARGRVTGAQVGIVNIAGDISGAQVGVVNIAGNVEGAQVGVFNYADEINGAPIGVFSFVRKGQIHLDVWANEYSISNIALKTGGKYIYSIIALGAQPYSDPYRWHVGAGIGGHIPRGLYFFNIEALNYQLNEGERWEEDLHQISKLRLIGGRQINPRVAVFAGVTLNVFVSNVNDGSRYNLGSIFKWSGDDEWVRIWPGFVLGVQF